MENSVVIPPGYSPPFAVVAENDHTAWVLIAASLGLACALLFGGIRILLRTTIVPEFGLDDYLVGAATVLTIIQSAVILQASHNGLGKTIDLVPTASMVKVQQLCYGGMLVFIIALGLSKLSVIAFLLRMTTVRKHRRIYYALAILVTAWTVASFFAIALQCNLSRPWAVVGETCHGTLLRWQIICSFDIITEIAMVVGSVCLVWQVQTSLSKKAIVVSTFAYRLLLVLPITFRLSTFKETAGDTDFLFGDLFVVWTQTQLNYAIISATIPMLRPFAKNLNTQFGGLGESESAYAHGSQSKSSNDGKTKMSTTSFQMSKLNFTSSQSRDAKANATTVSRPNFSGKEDFYRYDIHKTKGPETSSASAVAQGQPGAGNIAGDTRSVASNESQQQLMIRKDVTYKVEHHNVG